MRAQSYPSQRNTKISQIFLQNSSEISQSESSQDQQQQPQVSQYTTHLQQPPVKTQQQSQSHSQTYTIPTQTAFIILIILPVPVRYSSFPTFLFILNSIKKKIIYIYKFNNKTIELFINQLITKKTQLFYFLYIYTYILCHFFVILLGSNLFFIMILNLFYTILYIHYVCGFINLYKIYFGSGLFPYRNNSFIISCVFLLIVIIINYYLLGSGMEWVETENLLIKYRHCNAIVEVNNGNTLWLGDYSSAEDIASLAEKNIKMVITAAEGYYINYGNGIRHYKYNLRDVKTENIIKYFQETSQKISQGLTMGSVLVHCAAGVSRSATLVIAYLMKHFGYTFHEALTHCKKKRPQVCPNIGFERQLKLYERSLKKQLGLSNVKKDESYSYYDSFTNLPEIKNNHSSFLQKQQRIHNTTNNNMNHNNNNPHNMTTFMLERQKLKFKGRQKLLSEEKLKRKKNFTPNEEEYLKKMAEFRFGITNFGKWKTKDS